VRSTVAAIGDVRGDEDDRVVNLGPDAVPAHDPDSIDPGSHEEMRGKRTSGGGGDHDQQRRIRDRVGRLLDGNTRSTKLTREFATSGIEDAGDVPERVLMYGGENRVELIAVDNRYENVADHGNPDRNGSANCA